MVFTFVLVLVGNFNFNRGHYIRQENEYNIITVMSDVKASRSDVGCLDEKIQ